MSFATINLSIEACKRNAARFAVQTVVKDGMVLGLGTGSTVAYALELIGKLVTDEGYELVGIPTSKQTEKLARNYNIPLTSLRGHCKIDVTIDGADEVDPELNLIKGLGGALLREKVVAVASKSEIIIIDYTKRVMKLGSKSPLPIEVLPFAAEFCKAKLESEFNCSVEFRKTVDGSNSSYYITDNGNYILDCRFDTSIIANPKKLDAELKSIPGVIETGLFINLATAVIIGRADGKVDMIYRSIATTSNY